MKITPRTPEVVYVLDEDTPLESVEVDDDGEVTEWISSVLLDFKLVQDILKELYFKNLKV